jgi:hypothetical protein
MILASKMGIFSATAAGGRVADSHEKTKGDISRGTEGIVLRLRGWIELVCGIHRRTLLLKFIQFVLPSIPA